MNDSPGSEDERIRRLLNDAVSDVEPLDSLDSIRSRTVVTPFRSRRPWILGAGAAVVATAATVAAVAAMGGTPGTTNAQDPGFAGPSGAPASAEGSGMPRPDGSSAPPTVDDPTPPSMSTDESSAVSTDPVTVPVYYVGDTSRGPRLYREFHTVKTGDDGDPADEAVQAAIGVPPTDPDYQSVWAKWQGKPANVEVAGVTQRGGTITVDLFADGPIGERPSGMGKQEASMAVEQLIYTVQGTVQSRDAVQFMLNGERADTLLGVPISEPLAEGDPTQVLAQVWIIEPSQGAEVTGPFEVSGLAAAFEANVQWELMQGQTVVKKGHTTAKECCTASPYKFTVNVPPGDYTLVVHDEDASGGAEGFAPWQDTKDITVVG